MKKKDDLKGITVDAPVTGKGAVDDAITTIPESVAGKESVFISKSYLLVPKGVLKLQQSDSDPHWQARKSQVSGLVDLALKYRIEMEGQRFILMFKKMRRSIS